MAPPHDREEILSRLRETIRQGHAIVGAGAGVGLSAKAIEAGGGDLVVVYNSGRYRMGGRGSLAGLMPYGNANDVVLDMARQTLPLLARTPLLCGVCATDPTRPLEAFLRQLQAMGVAGVQNFPTVGKPAQPRPSALSSFFLFPFLLLLLLFFCPRLTPQGQV